MIFLYILLGIFAFLGLILALPIHICMHYDQEGGFQFRLKFAWIPLVDSSKEVPDKPKKEKQKRTSSGASSILGFLGLEDIASIANARKALDEKGLLLLLSDLRSAVGAIFARIGELLARGVFQVFTLRVTVGDTDAADCAINYGRYCAIIYPTITMLDSAMTFRKRTVDLRCDFAEESTSIYFDGQLRYRPWNFIQFLWGLIMNYLKRSVTS